MTRPVIRCQIARVWAFRTSPHWSYSRQLSRKVNLLDACLLHLMGVSSVLSKDVFDESLTLIARNKRKRCVPDVLLLFILFQCIIVLGSTTLMSLTARTFSLNSSNAPNLGEEVGIPSSRVCERLQGVSSNLGIHVGILISLAVCIAAKAAGKWDHRRRHDHQQPHHHF